MELYRKVFINSQEDLPKEGQKCICHLIMDDELIETAIFQNKHTESWFKNVDWYLIEQIEEPEPAPVSANYMQIRDLTDEEWLKLPKEEILQLYKNCYNMLIAQSQSKPESSTEPIKSAEEIIKNKIPNGIINVKSYKEEIKIIKECMEEYASQFSQKLEEQPVKTAEEILLEVKGGFQRITFQIAIRAMEEYRNQPDQSQKRVTDEEIEKWATNESRASGNPLYKKSMLVMAAKWMRDKIK